LDEFQGFAAEFGVNVGKFREVVKEAPAKANVWNAQKHAG
jgi:hypothetical protein